MAEIRKVFFETSIQERGMKILSVSGFLIGTGKIFHNITSRDDSDKGLVIVKHRNKILLHRLVQKIFHLRAGIYRAVVLAAFYFHDGDQFHIL